MAALEQLATAHEALVLLLRNLPRAGLIALMCSAAGIAPPEFAEVHERTPTVEIPRSLRRARLGIVDLVLVVRTAEGQISMIWILEVQLCWDFNKRWDWGLFPAAFAAESRAPAMLAAFVPDPMLRARIRRTLVPKTVPRPILIELDQIELIVDTAEARHRIHETVLGAVFHSRENTPLEPRVAGIRAAFVAIQGLDPWQRRSYTVLMLSTTPPRVAKRALDDAHERGELDADACDEISEIERTGYLFHVGREAGRQEVMRDTIIDVLELRGFALTKQQRARIQTCEDTKTLERWYAKARTLATGSSLVLLFA
jgi:hypothetical protein